MVSGRRNGVAMYYIVVAMVVMCGFLSFAADLGRVQLVKAELRRAADAAARAGAAGITVSPAEAVRLAQEYAGHNRVDGNPLVLNAAADIELGRWDSRTRSFTKLAGSAQASANAMRVIARKSSARGDGVPMLLAGMVGQRNVDVSAESIAAVTAAIDVDQYVPATANPFLAGMSPGSVASLNNPHNSPDYAGTAGNPRQSPLAVNMPIQEGQILTFDSISGTARHDPNLPFFDPDGKLTDIGHNNLTRDYYASYRSQLFNENGIADVIAPINCLVGVFLSDQQPNLTRAPANLDFSTPASRDFVRLAPELKQIFFIGDGLNSRGIRQEFVVPPGATRLFLATWDFYEWNNNYGFRNIKVNRPMQIVTVK